MHVVYTVAILNCLNWQVGLAAAFVADITLNGH